MDKLLSLAINFAKAPPELQTAAQALGKFDKDIAKAQSALQAKEAEIRTLKSNQNEAKNQFDKLLSAWDGEPVK